MEENEWAPYTGEREKEYYDIKLKTGEIVECCYPNSYSWFGMLMSPSKEYKDDEVEAIRKCLYHPLEHPRNTWRKKNR